MRQAKSVCLALALCVLPAAVLSAGEIYRWKDANGTWHYADQPVPGAERISGMKPPSAARPAAQTSASGSPAGAPSGSIGVAAPAPLKPETIAQVRAEANQARAEQCKKAREAYNLSIQARRIFRVNAKGEPEYLNEAEADASRLRARAQVEEACGSN
jgi:hypothetical protein